MVWHSNTLWTYKKSKKKVLDANTENKEQDDHNVESNTTFNLVEEHPSYKYMVMVKRNKYVIPQISCST